MNASSKSIGQPLDRVDGLLKVTGQARYAAEYPEDGLLHGSVVSGTVARGRVLRIDASRALALPGVVAVIDHTNRPRIASYDEPYQDADAADGSPFRPLFNDQVLYSGQPLALVVAENLELARYAGSLVEIEYEAQEHQTDLIVLQNDAHPAPAELPKPRGNFQGEYASAALSVDVSYSTPIEHHNPMEPHASTVLYQPDGSLHIHDKTQGTQNCQSYVQKVFGLEKEQVRVFAAFVGGAFGSGAAPAVSIAVGRDGGHGPQALGAGQPDAPADVHLWLSAAHPPARATGGGGQRSLAGRGAHRYRPDLALRGLHRTRGGVERHALSLRQR